MANKKTNNEKTSSKWSQLDILRYNVNRIMRKRLQAIHPEINKPSDIKKLVDIYIQQAQSKADGFQGNIKALRNQVLLKVHNYTGRLTGQMEHDGFKAKHDNEKAPINTKGYTIEHEGKINTSFNSNFNNVSQKDSFSNSPQALNNFNHLNPNPQPFNSINSIELNSFKLDTPNNAIKKIDDTTDVMDASAFNLSQTPLSNTSAPSVALNTDNFLLASSPASLIANSSDHFNNFFNKTDHDTKGGSAQLLSAEEMMKSIADAKRHNKENKNDNKQSKKKIKHPKELIPSSSNPVAKKSTQPRLAGKHKTTKKQTIPPITPSSKKSSKTTTNTQKQTPQPWMKWHD